MSMYAIGRGRNKRMCAHDVGGGQIFTILVRIG